MTITAQCCIAGAGPAGLMLGYLLARSGVKTVVLEKHADFLRDFRGDTIHPSTLQLMYELGLLAQFLKLPHHKLHKITARIGGVVIPVGDFTHLPVQCPYIAIMPQWDFLNFLAEQGKRYPTFKLMMQTEGTDLVSEGGAVVGVKAKTPQGEVEVRAPLQDQAALALPDQMGPGCVGEVEVAKEAGVEHFTEIRHALFVKAAGTVNSRIGHHDVQATGYLKRLGDHLVPALRITHITPVGIRLPAGLTDGFDRLHGGGVIVIFPGMTPVVHQHEGAPACEMDGIGAAKALACTGHDGRATQQIRVLAHLGRLQGKKVGTRAM